MSGGRMDQPFLELDTTAWTAINALGTVALTFATLGLAIVAYVQISAAREEARTNRTLIACERYDLDPTLDGICRRLAIARDSGDIHLHPKNYKFDVSAFLNYLECIAIGVNRGLYSGSLVRDYMEQICVSAVDWYITSGLLSRAVADDPSKVPQTDQYFTHLLALVKSWSDIPWYRRQT